MIMEFGWYFIKLELQLAIEMYKVKVWKLKPYLNNYVITHFPKYVFWTLLHLSFSFLFNSFTLDTYLSFLPNTFIFKTNIYLFLPSPNNHLHLSHSLSFYQSTGITIFSFYQLKESLLSLSTNLK